MTWEQTGELAALGTACCWTVTGLAFESAGRRIGSLSVNLIRLCIALALLCLWGALARGLPLPVDASARAWGLLSISGLIGFTIGDLLLFRAFVEIGSRLSLLLMSLVPPIAALLGWMLLGERLTGADWCGMGATVVGVSWVIRERTGRGESPPARPPLRGVLLGAGGAVGQAVGLVLSKLGMGDYDPFAATQIRVIAGIGGFAVLFVAIGWWPKVFAALADRGAMWRTGVGAVFGPFLGVSLSLLAVQRTETGVAATIMALVPVLVIGPSAWLMKESITPRAVIGALLAVGGVAVLFLT